MSSPSCGWAEGARPREGQGKRDKRGRKRNGRNVHFRIPGTV